MGWINECILYMYMYANKIVNNNNNKLSAIIVMCRDEQDDQ